MSAEVHTRAVTELLCQPERSRAVRSGLEAILRGDYEDQGNKYWQIDNVDVRDPLNLLSLRLLLESELWSASLWGKNIIMDRGINSGAF